jgi:hypothetical protein
MTNRLHREVRPELERLEDRTTPAVGTATLVGKTLVIEGPANGDDGGGASPINVRVVERGNKIRVIFTDVAAANAQTFVEFKESRVKTIDFRGTDGDDVFINRSDARVIANGGAGNDLIDTGDEDATVTGGAGADRIVSDDDDTEVTDASAEDIIDIDD